MFIHKQIDSNNTGRLNLAYNERRQKSKTQRQVSEQMKEQEMILFSMQPETHSHTKIVDDGCRDIVDPETQERYLIREEDRLRIVINKHEKEVSARELLLLNGFSHDQTEVILKRLQRRRHLRVILLWLHNTRKHLQCSHNVKRPDEHIHDAVHLGATCTSKECLEREFKRHNMAVKLPFRDFSEIKAMLPVVDSLLFYGLPKRIVLK